MFVCSVCCVCADSRRGTAAGHASAVGCIHERKAVSTGLINMLYIWRLIKVCACVCVCVCEGACALKHDGFTAGGQFLGFLL